MTISLRMDHDQVTAVITDRVKVGYSRQFNTVSIVRDDEVLRTDVVKKKYTLKDFMDKCFTVKSIFNQN